MRIWLCSLAFGALVLAGDEIHAHHAFSAEFDGEAPGELHGTVTKVQWINPHAWIHITVPQQDGTSVDWKVEGGTPNALMRTGITRKSLPVGAQIVVQGYQSKDRQCAPMYKANGRDMTFADGRKLFMGSSGTGAPDDGADPNVR